MTTGYVVVERGMHHNDEVYSFTEGGDPIKVFLNKDKAEKHAVELSMVKARNYDNVGEFGESVGDVTSLDADVLAEKLKELGVDWDDSEGLWELSPPSLPRGARSTPEDEAKVVDNIAAFWALFDEIKLFEVAETEIE